MRENMNRDLMVVMNATRLSPGMLDAETEWLHAILDRVETTQNLALACEIINLNRFKIERRHEKILTCLAEKSSRPFVFIFNKN